MPAPTPTPAKTRSWLFAPGDSARKMEKAAGGPADIVILDLEDAVATANKPEARRMVAEFLRANEQDRARLWVRINPLDGDWTREDLDAVMPARPGGIVLPKAEGRHHVEQLDALLSEREQASDIEPGSTPVMALVTETAAAMFTTGEYRGAPRLTGMSWGAEDLSDSLGAADSMNDDGSYRPVFELARSLCLLGAAAAGVTPIETIMGDFRTQRGRNRRSARDRAIVRGQSRRGHDRLAQGDARSPAPEPGKTGVGADRRVTLHLLRVRLDRRRPQGRET